MPGDLKAVTINRRNLLKISLAAGGTLLCGMSFEPVLAGEAFDGSFAPSLIVRLHPDGSVTFMMAKIEMGQGTHTTHAMMLAEELDVDMTHVTAEQAPASPDAKAYGRQGTGGSTSTPEGWKLLRQVGAKARYALVQAAATTWKVPAEECTTASGVVTHAASGRSIAYAELFAAAAKVTVPDEVPMKDASAYKIIGQPTARLEGPAKVSGAAMFGIDEQVPGRKVATVKSSPVLGGTVASVDDSVTRSLKGVSQVITLADGVVVVADNMWTAIKGMEALDIRWNEGPNAAKTMADIVGEIEAGVAQPGTMARQQGNAALANSAPRKVEAVYHQPFLSHAPMEPMNCTVYVKPDGTCEIWAGTQAATRAQAAVATKLGLKPEQVTIHGYLMGGAFGRRLEVDALLQGAEIAKQVDGPVQIIWTREEDMRRDMYRPYYVDRIFAGLDADGRIQGWNHYIAGSSVMARWAPQRFKGIDADVIECAAEPIYELPDIEVTFQQVEAGGVPTAFWRGVGPTRSIFVVESFIDELAAAAEKDPVEFRKALIKDPRQLAVLELVVEKSGWGAPLPKGRGRGISVQHAFGTYMAQVAEVSVDNNTVRLHRVVSALDCGRVINPLGVRAQVEGGVIFGATAALANAITVEKGRVTQSNFGDYPMLRINAIESIEVHVIESAELPAGVGETSTAGIAAAITNAIYAATGTRIRSLPISQHMDIWQI